MSFDLKLTYGDISLGPDGSVNIISGNNKIRQDIKKIILTKLGDNKYFPKYGSALGSYSIGGMADKELMELNLKQSISSALQLLISLQREQSKRQILSPTEIIMQINEIKAERDQVDPRLYNIYISVTTQSLEKLEEIVTTRIM